MARTETAPRVSIESSSRAVRQASNRWRMAWTLENQSERRLVVESAWLPHSRLRAAEKSFANLKIPPRARAEMEFDVTCSEPAGTEIENAFLIVRVRWRESRWRIFARLRVKIQGDGAPLAETESISLQGARVS